MQYNVDDKFTNMITWIAAITGLSSFAGIVSLAAGILSSIWIAVQLWAFFKYTLPEKRRAAIKYYKKEK